MKLPVVPILLALAGLAAPILAQDVSKNYSYSSSPNGSKQSVQEVEDIGEIVESKGFTTLREKLRFSVTARTAYTTNAKLDGSHSSGDLLFLPTLEVGFHTPLGQHFSFDVAAKIESATYARFDERGFAGYSLLATIDYTIRKGLPRFYATVEPYRYDSYDSGDLITQAIGFTGGVDWGVSFNAGRTLGFVGYSFSDYLSDPSIDSRLIHRGVIGLAHQIRSNLTGQLYYVYQFSDFTNFDREDSKHTVAGNLIYQFNEHWFGSLTTAFVTNDSDQSHASYDSFSTSLGLTVQF